MFFANAVMDSVVALLAENLTRGFRQIRDNDFFVETEALKLKLILVRIQALLKDAEDIQIRGESVRLWLKELNDAVPDAKDTVDAFELIGLRSKREGAQMQTRERKLTDKVFDLFPRTVFSVKMGDRIKEIRERLEEIESRGSYLLPLLNLQLKSEMQPGKRHPTSPIIDVSVVIGRETDREKVVGSSTSDGDSSAGNSGIQVVPICDMGGLGKTTLAQPACEHVVEHFEVFNEISSREMEKINVFKGMLKNYVFVGALTCAVAFQVIIIEFLGDFPNTTPLTSAQWFLSIFIGFLGIPIAAIIKLIALVSERDCMQAWKALKHYLPLYLPLLISSSLSLSFTFSLPLPFTPSLKLGLSHSPSLSLSLGSPSLSLSFSTEQRATSSSSSASPSSSSPASSQCCPSSSQEPFVPLQHPHHLCNCKTESHAALPDDCANSSRGMCIKPT